MMSEERLLHLTAAERQALHQFVAELESRFSSQLLDVRLFGSKARGDAGPESDLDVLVVVDGEERRISSDMGHIASRIELEFGVVLSDITMSKERFEWHRRHRAPFYKNVTREGIGLWTRR